MLKECMQAASLLLEQGLLSAVVNVLNLTRLDPCKLGELAEQAAVIVTVMDADPDALFVLLRRCLHPRHLAKVVPLGVSSYGEGYRAEDIQGRHGMDRQSLASLVTGWLGQRREGDV